MIRQAISPRLAIRIFLNTGFFPLPRHCEERSDAAIQNAERGTGLLCFARNDEAVGYEDFFEHLMIRFRKEFLRSTQLKFSNPLPREIDFTPAIEAASASFA